MLLIQSHRAAHVGADFGVRDYAFVAPVGLSPIVEEPAVPPPPPPPLPNELPPPPPPTFNPFETPASLESKSEPNAELPQLAPPPPPSASSNPFESLPNETENNSTIKAPTVPLGDVFGDPPQSTNDPDDSINLLPPPPPPPPTFNPFDLPPPPQ